MDEFSIKIFERVPILQQNNWSVWKFKTKLALKQLNLWSVIESTDVNGEKIDEKLDEKVFCLLGLWCDDSMVEVIKNCTTAKDMWQSLSRHFEPSSSFSSSTFNFSDETHSESIEPESEPFESSENSDVPYLCKLHYARFGYPPASIFKLLPDQNELTGQNPAPKCIHCIECTFCGKTGHSKRKCWMKRRRNKVMENSEAHL